MAFTGNIADWSLADILQVVAAERKSGVLNLSHPDGSAIELEFRDGQIVRASDRPDSGQGGFTTFLTETGHITPDQIRAVARLRQETKDDELEALERAGILDSPAHEGAFGAYCQELVYRALTWREGDYRFIARARSGAAGTRRHVQNIDALLMEGMRRIDEAPRIQEVVLPETVFERVADPRSVSAGLGRRENALIALVDGAKDARTLGHLAHLTEYEAGELLYNLHEAGLIRARKSADPLVLDLVEDAPSATSELARLVRLVIVLGLMGLSLFVSWQWRAARVAEGTAVESMHEPRIAEAEAFARELFRAYAGREPAGRIELERAELVVPRPPLTGSPMASEPAIASPPPSD